MSICLDSPLQNPKNCGVNTLRTMMTNIPTTLRMWSYIDCGSFSEVSQRNTKCEKPNKQLKTILIIYFFLTI